MAGRIQDIPSVKELVERITEEAEKIIKELPGKVIVEGIDWLGKVPTRASW